MLATSSKCQLIVYILGMLERAGDQLRGAEREALASKKSLKDTTLHQRSTLAAKTASMIIRRLEVGERCVIKL